MNNSIYRKAYIYVSDIYAGLLEETEDGYKFQYDEDYLSKYSKPVSLTLPLKKEPSFSEFLFPFFDGLIPEGWLLNLVCKNWKIKQNDRFGILLIACKDPIGNVSVRSIKQ